MPRRSHGFTLLELLLVLSIVALATAGATLSLRDASATRLEREALRLSALLEAARAQSRTSGAPVIWRALPQGFEFVGLPTRAQAPDALRGPRTWLDPNTRAEVVQPTGAQTLLLGPEPLIGAQSLELRLGERRLRLASDGLGPFAVVNTDAP